MIIYNELENGLLRLDNNFIPVNHPIHLDILTLVKEGKAKIMPYTVPVPTKTDKQNKINQESLSYLNRTDWYIVRMSETNVKVPDKILKARAAARVAIKDI
tara:strand:- start:4214 stop:4516 length:303 start_codon:yes stop_codon:yes gene_type:complete